MARLTDVVAPPPFSQTARAGSRTDEASTLWTWTFESEETSSGQMFSVYDCFGRRITGAYIDERFARLIAAAPELLAALERAREAVNAIVLSTHSVSFDADLRAIDAAIAAAKGDA